MNTTTAKRVIVTTLTSLLVLLAGVIAAAMIVGTVNAIHNTTQTQPAAAPIGCWNEPNNTMPSGYELIQGPITAAPVGSVIADCPTR